MIEKAAPQIWGAALLSDLRKVPDYEVCRGTRSLPSSDNDFAVPVDGSGVGVRTCADRGKHITVGVAEGSVENPICTITGNSYLG